MAKDLKLTATLDNKVSGEIEKIIGSLEKVAKVTGKVNDEHAKSVQEFVKQENQRAKEAFAISQAMNKDLEKAKREQARINESASRNTLQVSRNQAEAAQRIQRQAALAEAALIGDRFERRISIEKARHAQILTGLKGNNAASEAEIKRHAAVIARIQMDQKAFPNTPFQTMLGNFKQLNTAVGKMGPAISGMAGSFGTMGNSIVGAITSMGGMTLATGGALAAVTLLSAGIGYLINKYKEQRKAEEQLAKELSQDKTTKYEKIAEALKVYDSALKESAKTEQTVATAYGMQTFSSLESTNKLKKAKEELAKLHVFNPEEFQREQGGNLAAKIEEEKDKNNDLLSLQSEAANARNALIKDDQSRAEANENQRYAEGVAKYAGKAAEIELITKTHKDKIAAIIQDFEDKEFEKQTAKEQAKIDKQTEDNKKENDYVKKLKAEEVQADKEDQEKAKTVAAQKKAIDTTVFNNKVSIAKASSDLATAAFGKTKATFLLEKGVALGSIAVNTARAYTEALATPPGPPYTIPLAAGVLALGAIQGATVAATTIKGFSEGGYTGMGGREEPAGVVHRGEYVLSQKDLRNMGGVAAVEGMRNGGSGVNHRGDVNISIVLPANSTPSQAREAGAMAAEAYREKMKEFKRLERDSTYYGVTA